ncbi:hypothetical protein C2W62_11675 [Candidatus Entotheonella serta]|nr:hypothetical protein C2W62_11675 [Candidatus Entotheonella serta]
MYKDFYHLDYVPFTDSPDSDLMDLSRRYQVVFERVVKGLNSQQSLIAFLGEAGLGKVTLLRSALEWYSNPKCKAILIDIRKIHFQNQIYFKDIVKAVYQEIGYEIKYHVSPDALIDLHDIFIKEREKDTRFVVIIDHAHLLPLEVLKSIPKLIDADPDEEPLAQLILSGTPVLEQYLHNPNLQALKQRVQLVAKLDTFNRKESIAHIQRKLSQASPIESPKVFSNAAINKIVKAANGIPRNLNMLCTDVLVAGCRRRKRPIPVSIVKQVLADFQVRRSRRGSRFVRLVVTLVLVATLATGVTFRSALTKPLQTATQWSQQLVERVQPLIADLTQKVFTKSEQTTKPTVTPKPVEAPMAIPVERPLAVAVPPLISPKASPAKATVETTDPLPSKAVVEQPEASPAQTSVETALRPRPSMIQQVSSLIDQHFPKGGAFDLKVWSDKAPGQAYVENENLILYVESEAPAFLRIDYYQADGKIVHLLPNPLIDNRVQAGQRFVLGNEGNAFQFKVAPPFGTEMLTVMASQHPIESQAGTGTGELNRSYIDQLSRQLQTYGPQGKSAAAYVRINTQLQRPSRPDATELPSGMSKGKP